MTRAITYVDNSSSSGLLEIRLFVMRFFFLVNIFCCRDFLIIQDFTILEKSFMSYLNIWEIEIE